MVSAVLAGLPVMSPLERGTGQSALRILSLSALWELSQSAADTSGTDRPI